MCGGVVGGWEGVSLKPLCAHTFFFVKKYRCVRGDRPPRYDWKMNGCAFPSLSKNKGVNRV